MSAEPKQIEGLVLGEEAEPSKLSAGERLELGHRRFVARIREREEAARAAAEGALS